MYVSMYVCMHVCMYVYVCMYVCMYVPLYFYTPYLHLSICVSVLYIYTCVYDTYRSIDLSMYRPISLLVCKAAHDTGSC